MPLRTPAASHTSTHQWQSFEIKMRRRRAERCIQRAEAALEAGLEDEARGALDEARALDPETPGFDRLLADIQQRRAETAAARRRELVRRFAVAAALVAAICAGALWMGLSSQDRVDPAKTVSAPDSASRSTTTPPQVGDAVLPSAATSTGAVPLATAQAPMEAASVPTSGRDVQEAGVAPPGLGVPAAPSAPLPDVGTVASPRIVPSPSTSDVASAGVNTSPVAIDRFVTELPAAAVPVALTPVAPPPAPAPVSEEPKVREVLARFAAAYSSLSASTARAVWPGVDERALARAFDNLESQDVSLGRCTIALATATAHAECSGVTRWTPKVGGGSRSAPRRWQFELASRNGTWYIVRAESR